MNQYEGSSSGRGHPCQFSLCCLGTSVFLLQYTLNYFYLLFNFMAFGLFDCLKIKYLCFYPEKHDFIITLAQTCVTSGAGIAYLSGAPEFTPAFYWGSCCSIFSFMCSVLQIVVCHFVLFLLAIVLSVLRFTDSDYPFGIFKLFLDVQFLDLTHVDNSITKLQDGHYRTIRLERE